MKNWQDVDGWFDCENEIFFQDCLNNFKNNDEIKTFYEIGSWKGRSTCCMAQLIKKNNIVANLYAIDTFLGSDETIHICQIDEINEQDLTLFDIFNKNIEECGVSDIIFPIVSTSFDASKNVDDNSVDFIYIDANHEYESVKNDIQIWIPKMKKGSIMTGDDYSNSWTGVMSAVDEIFSKLEKRVDFGGYKDDTHPYGTQWRIFL
jgi:hypothetical protein